MNAKVMNAFSENYVSLSHSATGGETRKNLELLGLEKKCLLDHLRYLGGGVGLEKMFTDGVGSLLDLKWCSHRSQTH